MKRWLKMIEQRIRRLIYGDHEDSELRARRAVHQLSNEVQSLNAEVRRVRRAQDPWNELVKALRGDDNNHKSAH